MPAESLGKWLVAEDEPAQLYVVWSVTLAVCSRSKVHADAWAGSLQEIDDSSEAYIRHRYVLSNHSISYYSISNLFPFKQSCARTALVRSHWTLPRKRRAGTQGGQSTASRASYPRFRARRLCKPNLWRLNYIPRHWHPWHRKQRSYCCQASVSLDSWACVLTSGCCSLSYPILCQLLIKSDHHVMADHNSNICSVRTSTRLQVRRHLPHIY